MGGDDSQKLLPWRGIYFPSGAQTSGSNYEINNVTETAVGISWVPPPLASLALASATARLGHFWKAQVGQFCRAPKQDPVCRNLRFLKLIRMGTVVPQRYPLSAVLQQSSPLRR